MRHAWNSFQQGASQFLDLKRREKKGGGEVNRWHLVGRNKEIGGAGGMRTQDRKWLKQCAGEAGDAGSRQDRRTVGWGSRFKKQPTNAHRMQHSPNSTAMNHA